MAYAGGLLAGGLVQAVGRNGPIVGRVGAPHNTTADGLAVRVPIRGIVEELKSLVDEVWLVREESLLPAVRCLMELEQCMVELSPAIAIAGLVDHREDVAGRRVAAILTGSHLRPSLIPEVSRAVELIPPGGRR